MKILSSEQTHWLDKETIKRREISSWQLMEEAANALFQWLQDSYQDKGTAFSILCGPGNNGGDGLALARMLWETGYKNVQVFIALFSAKSSLDHQLNFEKLQSLAIPIHFLVEEDINLPISKDTIWIDALFGSGLNRPLEGAFAQCVDSLNELACHIIAIDIPSGLFADPYLQKEPEKSKIVKANHVLCLGMPKLSLLLPSSQDFASDFSIIDFGLDQQTLEEIQTNTYYLDTKWIQCLVKHRTKYSHKGSFGHALIAAGSFGKIGAAVLAAKACLKSGVGLLTVQVPSCGYEIMQISVPEAMCLADAHEKVLSQVFNLSPFQVVGVGPGIGKDRLSAKYLLKLMQKHTGYLVLDADALNLIAADETFKALLGEHCLLTPHPGEFSRLVGSFSNEAEKLDKLKSFCAQYRCHMVLKGAHSVYANPDGQLVFNSTGNPGMATGGSGDVLTGIMTALLAQAYSMEEAACLGMYLHGYAGDLASYEMGEEALTAGSIVNYIGSAFQKIKNQ